MQLTDKVGEVDGRVVYGCPHCKMKQFLLRSQRCRRCAKTMLVPTPELPPEQLLPVAPPPLPVHAKGAGIYEVIAARIFILRLSKGWSQHDLAIEVARATEAGSAHSWISRVESGVARPSAGMVDRFARTFQVPFWELTRGFPENWLHDEAHELLPQVPKKLLPVLRKFLHCLIHDRETAFEFSRKMGLPLNKNGRPLKGHGRRTQDDTGSGVRQD